MSFLKAYLENLRKRVKDPDAVAEIDRAHDVVGQVFEEALDAARDARQPKAYGYARVSHKDSADSGLSLEYQELAIKRYVKFLQETVRPDIEWGGMFVDKIVSAFTQPLVERKAGKELDRVLKRGDLVVIYHIDRGFRNVKDCLITIEDIWGPKGIEFAFVEPTINTGSPYGRYMLVNFVNSAQLESELKAEKIRAIMREKKANGGARGPAPWGWKNIGTRGKRRAVVDETKRDLSRLVLFLREVENMPWLDMRPHVAALDQAIRGMNAPDLERWHFEKLRHIHRVGRQLELRAIDTRIAKNQSKETRAAIAGHARRRSRDAEPA